MDAWDAVPPPPQTGGVSGAGQPAEPKESALRDAKQIDARVSKLAAGGSGAILGKKLTHQEKRSLKKTIKQIAKEGGAQRMANYVRQLHETAPEQAIAAMKIIEKAKEGSTIGQVRGDTKMMLYGMILNLAQLADHGQKGAADITAYITELAESGSALLGSAISALHTLSQDPELSESARSAILQATADVVAMSQQRMQEGARKMGEHTAPRTGQEVVVHALSLIRKTLEQHPNSEILKNLEQDLIKRMGSHDLGETSVRAALLEMDKELWRIGLEDLAIEMEMLREQMPTDVLFELKTALENMPNAPRKDEWLARMDQIINTPERTSFRDAQVAMMLTDYMFAAKRPDLGNTLLKIEAKLPHQNPIQSLLILRTKKHQLAQDPDTTPDKLAALDQAIQGLTMLLREPITFPQVVFKTLEPVFALDDPDLTEALKATEHLGTEPSDTGLSRARLYDNIYGRVYDSSLIDRLVKTPPKGVKKAAGAQAKAFAGWMERTEGVDPTMHLEVATKIQQYIQSGDPRFWFPKVPAMEKIRDAASPQETLDALLEFLEAEPQTGHDVVAISYLTIKIALGYQSLKQARRPCLSSDQIAILHHRLQSSPPHSPEWNGIAQEWDQREWGATAPWMQAAGYHYGGVVGTEKRSQDWLADTRSDWTAFNVGKTTDPYLDSSSGITLRHQPAINPDDPQMAKSQRPTTRNRPNINAPSQSMDVAFQQGAAWASGVSGSTNIALWSRSFFLANGLMDPAESNSADLLLATMMFLTYDGGHSMHEALWTANSLNEALGLQIELGKSADSRNPNAFVSDYDAFFAGLPDPEDQKLAQEAASGAIDDTVEYLETYTDRYV